MFEFGHEIIPGTEWAMFPRANAGANRYSHRLRCFRCQSERYHWRRQSGWQKAGVWINDHSEKMVKRQFANTPDEAKRVMAMAGVTQSFVAEMFRNALDQPCPGLCGWPDRHVISSFPDCQGDWRDPRFPITRENIGPLCATCNQQKHEMPWAAFIARQHAIRINLERGKGLPAPPLQLDLFECE